VAWRFFHRLFVLPGVSINVSKSGPSISVGPQGAKLTVGPQGVRATAGLPGTGLHVTNHVPWSQIPSLPPSNPRAEWVNAFWTYLYQCLTNPAISIAGMRAALDYGNTLGVTDHELGPDGLHTLERIRTRIAELEAQGHTAFYPGGFPDRE
jgi:hypothetical protein